MSIVNPTCPDDCSSLLPVLEFDFCAPDVHYGSIDTIYLTTRTAGGLTDWTSLAEWQSRISNTSLNADAIRELSVMGSKAAPERNSIEISGGRKVHSPAVHQVAIKVDETSADNYEFLRTLECNGTYLMWYASGKYIYGGNDGIEIDQMFLDDIIPESSQELNIFEGVAEWEAQFHPERTTNPMA